MVAVDGPVTHPFVLNGWKEGAIILEWAGDRTLVPCQKIEPSSKEKWLAADIRDWNSSFAGQLGLPGWGEAVEEQEVEGMLVNSATDHNNSLESHGLGTAGNSLYVRKASQLGENGLLLCLGEMRINLTAREGGGCEGRDKSEWCAAKVFHLSVWFGLVWFGLMMPR